MNGQTHVTLQPYVAYQNAYLAACTEPNQVLRGQLYRQALMLQPNQELVKALRVSFRALNLDV